jgi:mercuric ion binding protein
MEEIKIMSITHNSSTKRLAALALALGLSFLVGCSDQPAAGPNTGHSAQAFNDANTATELSEAVFSVPGMDCPMCPITVRRALSGIDGVYEAEADLKTREAHAVFDPSRTNAAALIAAIGNAGFSAHLKESAHE